MIGCDDGVGFGPGNWFMGAEADDWFTGVWPGGGWFLGARADGWFIRAGPDDWFTGVWPGGRAGLVRCGG